MRARRAACPSWAVPCATDCALLANDPKHCGACATACAPNQSCAKGTCVAACPAGTTDCARACADLASDPAHCGDCGTRCPTGEACALGACK